MIRIAFLASHNGSSARAITDACLTGELPMQPVLLISNNPDSKALEWAQAADLQTFTVNAKNTDDVDSSIAAILANNRIDLVVCSGYMKLIGPRTIAAAHGAILNVHPALLPKYGGKGMYGHHVHEAVLKNGDKETGITIHLVDGQYDHGRTIAQKTIPLHAVSNADDIADIVKMQEPAFYVETLKAVSAGLIKLN